MSKDVAFERGKSKTDAGRSERWYKAYPTRFLKRTEHLPFELRCQYRFVLDVFYEQDGPLPNDDARIARRLGCGVLKWRPIRDKLIAAKLIYVGPDGMLHQTTVDEVIAERKDKAKKVRVGNARRRRVLPKIPGDMSGGMSGDTPEDFSQKPSNINGDSENPRPYARSSTDRYSLEDRYPEEDGNCRRGEAPAPDAVASVDDANVVPFPERGRDAA